MQTTYLLTYFVAIEIGAVLFDIYRLLSNDGDIRNVRQGVHQLRLLRGLRLRLRDLPDGGAKRRRRNGGDVWTHQQHGGLLRRRTAGQLFHV